MPSDSLRARMPSKIKLEKAIKKWTKKIQPLMDAARESERITGDDLRIVINARAEDVLTNRKKRRKAR